MRLGAGKPGAESGPPVLALGHPVGVGLSHPLPLRSRQAAGRIGHLPAALTVCGRRNLPTFASDGASVRREMVVTGPGQQRSKAELTADIRARRRTALVVNVRSRRGRRHYPTVCRQLHTAGLDLLDLHPVTDPRRLPQALAAAVDSGADLIVVGGGDGTLSEATHQLAHRDLCLGVLPLGTTNNFARSLGLPLHLPAALRILTEGKVADVDLGHVAGRHFANLTSLGLSVQVAEHVPHPLKRILGRAAYPLTALALLPRHRPFTARLRINHGTGNDGDDGTRPSMTAPTAPTARTAGCTSWSPTSSTSPTAATTPAGRSPATPAWTTGNW